eukprot:scaffold99374_cov67-Cyclotella_meneghiniana.AAC.9
MEAARFQAIGCLDPVQKSYNFAKSCWPQGHVLVLVCKLVKLRRTFWGVHDSNLASCGQHTTIRLCSAFIMLTAECLRIPMELTKFCR